MLKYDNKFFLDQEGIDAYIQGKKNFKCINGINYDLNDRWEKGIPHHPKTIALMERILDIDYYFNDDYFSWKLGGDGDNGEIFAYTLDVYFEEEDKKHNI